MEHIKKTLFAIKAHKAIVALIIIEELKSFRSLQQIRSFLLNNDENLVFKNKSGSDGKGIRNYLDQLTKHNLLETRRNGKRLEWRTKKRDYSGLTNLSFNFNNDELKLLKSYNEIFNKYHFLPYPHSIQEMINELEEYIEGINIQDAFSPISLGIKSNFSGEKYFTDILYAIEDRSIITFKYKKFPLGDGRKQHISIVKSFLPYLLKEHENRWYVIGKWNSNADFVPYALDRIVSDIKENGNTFERDAFDEKTLFAHSSGIFTSWTDDKGERSNQPSKEISFKLKNGKKFNNVEFIKSNPIHSSQIGTYKFDKNGYVKIKLEMFIDADLVRKLRSYGVHNLKNIKPTFLDDWVRNE